MDTLYYGYEPQTEDVPIAVQFIWEGTAYECFPTDTSPTGRPVWGHRVGNPVFGAAAGLQRWVVPGWGSDSEENWMHWAQLSLFGSAIFTPCYSDDQYNWQRGRVQGDPSFKVTGHFYAVSAAAGGGVYEQVHRHPG